MERTAETQAHSKPHPATALTTRTLKFADDAHSRSAESDLLDRVAELKARNRIVGVAPTLEQLLDAPQEREVSLSEEILETDEEVVAQLHQESVDAEEGASDDEDNDSETEVEAPSMSTAEVLDVCRKLEQMGLESLGKAGPEMALAVRKFCAEVVKTSLSNSRQTTLFDAWGGQKDTVQ
jgi:hypothetical protein